MARASGRRGLDGVQPPGVIVPGRWPENWPVILLLTVMGVGMALAAGVRGRPWSTSCYATNNCDALTFAVAGELVRDGQSPYSTDARRVRLATHGGGSPPFVLPFQYPPHSLPIFAVLSVLFHSPLGFLVWIGASTLAFLVTAVLLVRREIHQGGTFLYAILAGSGLIVFNALLGQTGALIAALATGASLLWVSHPASAGLLLGLLTIKPHYALPLAMVAVVRRETRLVAAMVACVGALVIISGALFGFSYWSVYPHVLGGDNFTGPFMVSWLGLAQRLWPTAQFSPRTTIAVYAVCLIATTAVVLWLDRRGASALTQTGLVVACTLSFSPNTHPYDLLLLAPAFVVLGTHRVGLAPAFVFVVLSWIALPPPLRWLLVLAVFACAGLCTWVAIRDGRRSTA